MRIYTKIVMDKDFKEISADSIDYHGEICYSKGGGGSTTNTQDPEYNRRMASIAEQELGMGKEYFNVWKSGGGRAMDMEQIAANRELIPIQTDVAKQEAWLQGETADANRQLLPLQTDFQKEQIKSATELMPWQTGTAKTAMGGAQAMMQQAGEVNDREWMGQYQADAAQGFQGAETQLRRSLAARGLNQDSKQYQDAMRTLNFDKAKAVGGARTMGRRDAGKERFNRTGAATAAATNLWR